jgi:DNA-binding winged helix-turn-helix (wHTH) protein
MSHQLKPIYEFGPYRLDVAERILSRDGKVVPLQPKVFDLLLVMVERHGRLLGKDELMKSVWPDTVVEEANLANNISILRKTLGENGRQFIETAPKRGYRFVADVRESNAEGAERVIQELQTAGGDAIAEARPALNAALPIRGIKRHKRGLAVALAASLVGVAAIIYVASSIRQRFQTGQAPLQRKLSRLTYDTGLQSEPTWSPDGNMIAYSSDRSGNFDLWVQPVSEGNPVQVTTSAAHDWQPDWSPDGTRLVFRSERDGGGLFIVPALGGAERKIAGFGCRPRWSPDGSRILFYSSTLQNVVGVPKVYLAELDGKPPRELAPEFLGEFNYLRAAWHPDGQRISVWGSHLKRPHLGWSFWTISLSGGAIVKSEISAQVEQQLKTSVSFKDFSNFLWAPSGQALYFEGSYEGVRNLWRVEVEPQTLSWIAGPERLTTDPGPDTEIAISPDGKKLAYTIRTERTRIWSLPFKATARNKHSDY